MGHSSIQPSASAWHRWPGRGGTIAVAACLLAVLAVGAFSTTMRQEVTVYALSFGHYFAYWLAYRHGAVDPRVFRRDSILLKSASLAAFAWAFASCGLDALALGVMAAGFGLNALGARALGTERTYYGAQLTALPPSRISSFPFNAMSHPMLAGNMLAYAGSLLNKTFCANWWPLACTHVALNAGLIVMEWKVRPLGGRSAKAADANRPRSASSFRNCAAPCAFIALGAAAGAGAQGAMNSEPTALPPMDAALVGAISGLLVVLLHRAYALASGPAPALHSSET